MGRHTNTAKRSAHFRKELSAASWRKATSAPGLGPLPPFAGVNGAAFMAKRIAVCTGSLADCGLRSRSRFRRRHHRVKCGGVSFSNRPWASLLGQYWDNLLTGIGKNLPFSLALGLRYIDNAVFYAICCLLSCCKYIYVRIRLAHASANPNRLLRHRDWSWGFFCCPGVGNWSAGIGSRTAPDPGPNHVARNNHFHAAI